MTTLSTFSSADLKVAENVLLCLLDNLSEARHERLIVEARRLPCGGGCQVVTWQPGAWCCPAVHHATDLTCQLQEHHIGSHIHCNPDSDDPTQHKLLRWADQTREVA